MLNVFFGSLLLQNAAASNVVVPGITTPPKGNGNGISHQMLMSSVGSQNGYCQDLQGDWYPSGTKITNSQQHRQAVCQPNGSWLDYDTCPTDAGYGFRLDNARNCWYSCYNVWGRNCDTWCSCTRQYNKLGSSGPSSTDIIESPPLGRGSTSNNVEVTGITTPPKGNGNGKSLQVLMAQNGGSRNGYCQDLQGDWYPANTEITNRQQHRQAICQYNGSWKDFDTCPTDMNNPAYRLDNARNCWYSCYNVWGRNCNQWCSCQIPRQYRLGSAGPSSTSTDSAQVSGDPFNAQVGVSGPQVGVSGPLSWLFPGTEGASCWFGQWCYPGLECRKLLGNTWGATRCVRKMYPVPSPIPMPFPQPVPSPVPVPFGGGRRLEGLERIQEQMN